MKYFSLKFTSFLILFLAVSILTNAQQDKLLLNSGKVNFTSDAPLELIQAASDKLKGVIEPSTNRFAFSIPIKSFEGFNSPLQREHFNENYMESDKFPNATFDGKIIEVIDFNKNGDYTVRAKGNLTIHGVTQERIIRSKLQIKDGTYFVNSQFSVLLKEHDITIPKIVNQKIAEEIMVDVTAEFSKK